MGYGVEVRGEKMEGSPMLQAIASYLLLIAYRLAPRAWSERSSRPC